ncbi:hypothetical protein BH09PSE5_BH09PSE5_46070 [soil metagenome]
MLIIPLSPRPDRADRLDLDAAQRALGGVISSVGDNTFGTSALASLNEWMLLSWWTVYRLYTDRPPVLCLSGSFETPDGTAEPFRSYRGGLYRYDQSFDSAWNSVRDGVSAMTHFHASEFSGTHRRQIYQRHGLRERLSLVSSGDEGSLLAVNLYRREDQAGFSDSAIDSVRSIAHPLIACVSRHISLRPAVDGPDRAALEVFATLTRREADVCRRMLKGMTHDGIAIDLGISAGTVKTYRNRAFEKLGIHHRNELFALALARSNETRFN